MNKQIQELGRAMLAKHLTFIAEGKPYNELFSHDFSKVSKREDHSTEIINKNGIPHSTCYCDPVCNLEGDGTGILIHKDYRLSLGNDGSPT